MHWDGDGSWWSGSWWWMALMMVAVWVVIATTVVMVVRALTTPKNTHDARAVLDDRYARGELEDDEYRRRRTALREP